MIAKATTPTTTTPAATASMGAHDPLDDRHLGLAERVIGRREDGVRVIERVPGAVELVPQVVHAYLAALDGLQQCHVRSSSVSRSASTARRAVNCGLMWSLMMTSRSSKGMNALFMALMANHCMSLRP